MAVLTLVCRFAEVPHIRSLVVHFASLKKNKAASVKLLG